MQGKNVSYNILISIKGYVQVRDDLYRSMIYKKRQNNAVRQMHESWRENKIQKQKPEGEIVRKEKYTLNMGEREKRLREGGTRRRRRQFFR